MQVKLESSTPRTAHANRKARLVSAYLVLKAQKTLYKREYKISVQQQARKRAQLYYTALHISAPIMLGIFLPSTSHTITKNPDTSEPIHYTPLHPLTSPLLHITSFTSPAETQQSPPPHPRLDPRYSSSSSPPPPVRPSSRPRPAPCFPQPPRPRAPGAPP